MPTFRHHALVGAILTLLAFSAAPAMAQDATASGSPRIALVIGNGAYRTSPLPTAANDAGLVAQTLVAAGFDVTGARDLDGAALRRAIRDFIDMASAGGPRGIALVYLAGHAVQFEGDNYFAPTDAPLDRASGMPIETFRIADLTRALAATNLGAKVVIVDGVYADPRAGGPLAGGLALVDPEPGTLLAFNAAPGTVAPVEAGPYGTYARLLARNMKQGSIPVEEMFDRLRVATHTETHGAVVPWSVSKLLQGFTFFDRAADAPAMGSAQIPFTSLRTRPLKDFSPEQAYDVVVARDTLSSYQDYLTVFPDHPLARRIRLIVAVRREAMVWQAAARADAPQAFWTYLRRYPQGPHGAEAQRRLGRLAAAKQPPADFAPLAFDVPPPPEDELVFVERRMTFADPDLPPPPPPPLFLLPPLRAEEMAMEPPPKPPGPRLLPVPVAAPILFVRPIIEPGVLMPPNGTPGAYPQPRPFAAGAPTGGLVPRMEEPKSGDHPPAPLAPSSPVPFTRPLPAPPGAPTPVAPVPAPVPRPIPVTPLPRSVPAVLPAPQPAVPSALPKAGAAPLAPVPHKPALPEGSSIVPVVPAPKAPAVPSVPSPTVPTQPAAPRSPTAPSAVTPSAAPPKAARAPAPARPPVAAKPPADARPPVDASETPQSAGGVQSKPLPGKAPVAPAALAPPKPAAPSTKSGPAPAAGAAAHPAEPRHHEARPECSHPGQPPCRP